MGKDFFVVKSEIVFYNTAFISLGSNMNNPLEQLKQALNLISNRREIHLIRVSDVYETEPVGMKNQEKFYNMAACLRTHLTYDELFSYLTEIENKLLRIRTIRWGPRTIDLDLLLFNKLEIETENLIIPHPRMFLRGFVLYPLLDVLSSDDDLLIKKALVSIESLKLDYDSIKRKGFFSCPGVSYEYYE
jgi:2-amino-4-hydroxy-6-hydroxymethyldihydropteridine diphosphokinase